MTDWKNLSALVKRHETESCHVNASARAECYKDIQSAKSESINKKMSDSVKITIEKNRHILKKIVDVIVLGAKQDIPLRGHTEENSNFSAILTTFTKSDDILSAHLASAHYNAKYTSPEVQNEIIDICSEQIKDNILRSCRSCPFFALKADEATDKATKEQLSPCVRFVDGTGAVREEFLGFIECSSIKGNELCTIILSFLQEANLDLLKLRAQCYDGASNMSGKYRGVQALIRERSPHANYVHCKSHCLNLALVHSSNIPCIRTMMATVQDIGFMFGYSAKRPAALTDELSRDAVTKEQMNQRQKLRKLCETRWSSRADALATFENAFPVVVHALETLEQDHDGKAGQYLHSVLRFDFIVTLVVAKHMLNSTVNLTNLLQKEDNDLLHAVGEARVVIQLMIDERNDPEVWNALYEKATNIAAEFEIPASRPRRAGMQIHRANPAVDTVSEYWKITLFNTFMDHLIQEMETQIVSNEERFVAQYLLPNRLPDLLDDMLPSIYAAYAPDLENSFQVFSNEVTRWRVRWNIAENKPLRYRIPSNKRARI